MLTDTSTLYENVVDTHISSITQPAIIIVYYFGPTETDQRANARSVS